MVVLSGSPNLAIGKKKCFYFLNGTALRPYKQLSPIVFNHTGLFNQHDTIKVSFTYPKKNLIFLGQQINLENQPL